MTPSQWGRVKECYDAVLSYAAGERQQALERLSAGDSLVRREVERLLNLDPPSDFLKSSIPDSGGAVAEMEREPPVTEWHGLQIRGVLGNGGFGRVYRAWDSKLNRDVALKLISTSDLTPNATKEAHTLARLRHSNIVQVYGADSENGYYGLWMELIRGQTLQEILDRLGPFSAREIGVIGIEICKALAAVHSAKLIHRDIKAQNVMREEGGRIVLMDFGLGKEFGGESTARSHETLAGTPAYMAPELISGGKASVRSDIYAVGVLLFRLATNAFPSLAPALSKSDAGGHSTPDSLHDLRPDLNWGLVRIVERALDPDPAARFASAGQMLAGVSEWLQAPESAAFGVRAVRRARRYGLAAAGLLALAGVATAFLLMRPQPAANVEWAFHRLTSDNGLTQAGTVSADGKVLAYESDRAGRGDLDIWVQLLPGGKPFLATDSPDDERQPALSADGRWLAYRSERQGGALYARSLLGGVEEALIAKGGLNARFSPDATQIAFWTGEPGNTHDPTGKIFLAPSAGGPVKQLVPNFADARNPVWSPDGKLILFQGTQSTARPVGQTWDWWLIRMGQTGAAKTGAFDLFRRTQLSLTANSASWVGDRIVFSARMAQSTDLWSLRISADGAIHGAPERITSGNTFAIQPWAASGGKIFYTLQSASVNVFGVALAGTGQKPLRRLTSDDYIEERPTISREGTSMAFAVGNAGEKRVRVRNLQTGSETDVPVPAATDILPAVDPKGSRIAYSAFVSGKEPIRVVPLAGGSPETLCEDCGELQDWSPDCQWLLYAAGRPKSIYRLNLHTGEKQLLASDPAAELGAASLSRDGKWLAFSARQSGGSLRIFVTRVPGAQPAGSAAWTAITDTGFHDDKPRWLPDGRTIVFVSDRDGFQCIWKQRLDRGTMRPEGSPEPFEHLHANALSMQRVSRPGLNLGVSDGMLIFNLAEVKGNIWVAEEVRK